MKLGRRLERTAVDARAMAAARVRRDRAPPGGGRLDGRTRAGRKGKRRCNIPLPHAGGQPRGDPPAGGWVNGLPGRTPTEAGAALFEASGVMSPACWQPYARREIRCVTHPGAARALPGGTAAVAHSESRATPEGASLEIVEWGETLTRPRHGEDGTVRNEALEHRADMRDEPDGPIGSR